MVQPTRLKEAVEMPRGISYRQAGHLLPGALLHTIALLAVYTLALPRTTLSLTRPGRMSLKMATMPTYLPELEPLRALPLSIWQTHSIYQVALMSR